MMVLSLTPAPQTMLSSIFSKPSSSAKQRVEGQISETKLPIRVWEFLRRPQQEFTICTQFRRQLLTTKSDKGRGRKGSVINNTSQPDFSLSFCFSPPLYPHWSLRPSLSKNSPPQFSSCRDFLPFPPFAIVSTGKLLVYLVGVSDYQLCQQLESVL